LWFIPLYFTYFPLAIAFLLYLPFFLSLSEFRGHWLTQLHRSGPLGRISRWYFRPELITTTPLNKQCIIGVHHHGLLPFGSTTCLGTDACGYSTSIPSLQNRVVIAASFVFLLPFWRELCLAMGIIDCNKWNVKNWIEKGYTIIVFPGGAREALYSNPDLDIIDLTRKRGFIRLAMQYGLPVVPAFAFNEVDHYFQLSYEQAEAYPLFRLIRQAFHNTTGIMLPVLFNALPRRVSPVITITGRPVEVPHTNMRVPSDAEVDKAMKAYIIELRALYDQNAPKYNSRRRELKIT
jgi:hypothetical protein